MLIHCQLIKYAKGRKEKLAHVLTGYRRRKPSNLGLIDFRQSLKTKLQGVIGKSFNETQQRSLDEQNNF